MWDWIKTAAGNTIKFLDGKKTTIGFVLVAGSELVPDPLVSGIMKILGAAIGGVGVTHKVKKGELKLKDGNKKIIS